MKPKKLSLSKQTVANLSRLQMKVVGGKIPTFTCEVCPVVTDDERTCVETLGCGCIYSENYCD